MIYSCATDYFALLIVVDTAQVDTAVSPRSAFVLVLIAVDTKLSRLIYRPGQHGSVV